MGMNAPPPRAVPAPPLPEPRRTGARCEPEPSSSTQEVNVASLNDDLRDPPAPVPPTPSEQPPVEEPDEAPPAREEPGTGDPAPSEAPMIA